MTLFIHADFLQNQEKPISLIFYQSTLSQNSFIKPSDNSYQIKHWDKTFYGVIKQVITFNDIFI